MQRSHSDQVASIHFSQYVVVRFANKLKRKNYSFRADFVLIKTVLIQKSNIKKHEKTLLHSCFTMVPNYYSHSIRVNIFCASFPLTNL